MANRGANADRRIKELVNSKDWNSLARYCEELEFDWTEDAADRPSYTVQLLTYLILNELNNARFLWKRISKKFREDPELTAAWEVGKTMWFKNYTEFYSTINQHQWNGPYVPFIEALTEVQRRRTVELVSNTYTNVSVGDLAGLLGLAEDGARAIASSLSWREEGSHIYPQPIAKREDSTTKADHLQSLTNYVVFLEAK